MTLLEALEQACREAASAGICSGLMKYAKTDAAAVVNHGACTPRIAYILQWPEARVRRQLHAMAEAGVVLKHQWRPATPIRWWPVGLLERMRARGSEGGEHG